MAVVYTSGIEVYVHTPPKRERESARARKKKKRERERERARGRAQESESERAHAQCTASTQSFLTQIALSIRPFRWTLGIAVLCSQRLSTPLPSTTGKYLPCFVNSSVQQQHSNDNIGGSSNMKIASNVRLHARLARTKGIAVFLVAQRACDEPT